MVYPHINKLPRIALIKTYGNGVEYKTTAHLDRANEYRAKIDTEDGKAGLTGIWTEQLIYID